MQFSITLICLFATGVFASPFRLAGHDAPSATFALNALESGHRTLCDAMALPEGNPACTVRSDDGDDDEDDDDLYIDEDIYWANHDESTQSHSVRNCELVGHPDKVQACKTALKHSRLPPRRRSPRHGFHPRLEEGEPYCLCIAEDGFCTQEFNICVDPPPANVLQELVQAMQPIVDQASASYQAMYSENKEGMPESFCLCATQGNGTCKPDTEYCIDHPEMPPHKPLCLCETDVNGQCKPGSQVCSENVPPFKRSANNVITSGLVSSDQNLPSYFGKRQGVEELIAPPENNPEGSTNSYDGQFGIIMIGADSPEDMPPSDWSADDGQCFPANWFLMNLQDGVLTDNAGRRGYIAANNQLQFDDPPQAGAVWTTGFFMSNGVLGLGQNYTFDSCASGAFANIYNAPIGAQCAPVFLKMMQNEGECTDDDYDTDED